MTFQIQEKCIASACLSLTTDQIMFSQSDFIENDRIERQRVFTGISPINTKRVRVFLRDGSAEHLVAAH
jgi:hypothetical protein